jgi:DNA-binding PadR family transcriptional regulator
LRSRLNWLILKTLVLNVKLPLAAAELFETVRTVLSARSIGQYEAAQRHPSALWRYLVRLADKGFVKLEGLRRRKRALLTPAGRQALLALEARMRRRGHQAVLSVATDLAGRVKRLREGRLHRICPADLMRRMRRQEAALRRQIPGRPRATAFVSYDLPRPEANRRRLILAVLKGHGFARLHQSMYTGPSERLRPALEDLELSGVLPCLRWGTITVFSP